MKVSDFTLTTNIRNSSPNCKFAKSVEFCPSDPSSTPVLRRHTMSTVLNSPSGDTSLDPTLDLSNMNAFRPKRRTATKVDYSEKKEEEDYEQSAKPQKASGTPSSKPKSDISSSQSSNTQSTSNSSTSSSNGKKRQKKSPSAPTVSNHNRSESPSLDDVSNSLFPLNYEPERARSAQFSHILDLTGAIVKDKVELKLKDGTSIKKDDNIYLICEPPGEPYYIGRIMGFATKSSKHATPTQNGANPDEDATADSKEKPMTRASKTLIEPAENYTFKINWWYRCRDISKKSTDSRLLYASMHSDTCPIQSFRGKCLVKHRDEIEDLDEYRSQPNQFWFDKLFDRYMIKFYDVLPTSMLTSLPPNYQKALNKRFQYIFIEQGRSKDMLQSPKSCAKCNQWCSTSDSIECCECHEFYHMLCLDPPLLKKPARGFAWSCIKCTRKLENGTTHVQLNPTLAIETSSNNQEVVTQPKKLPSYEELAIAFLEKDNDLTFEERRNHEEWIYRYLGMHAKLEDALDLQDRPYPRAVSRLGNKHQLTGIQDWYGHRVEYYDNAELDEKYQKTTPSSTKKKKSDGRRKKTVTNDHLEDEDDVSVLQLPEKYRSVTPEQFPPWLQERPKGYIERGGDATATLMWKQPQEEGMDEKIQRYIDETVPIAKALNLIPTTPNFVDAVLKNLLDSNYDFEKAQALNQKLTRESLKEPTFTPLEVQRFENGIRKYGSELYPTFKEVKTQSFAMIVRFYYLWKKTKNGHLIWDNFDGRKKNHTSKSQKVHNPEDDMADDADDSSYDDDKVKAQHAICKHCKSEKTTRWYRAPGQQHPDNKPNVLFALCSRCARLWRRYAVVWEDPNEVMRKTGQKGGNGWKKKVESELIADSDLIMKARDKFLLENPNGLVEPETANGKRKSVEPVPSFQEEKKPKKNALPDIPSKPKEKKSSAVSKHEKPKEVETPAIVISNIVNVTNNGFELQNSILERFYHSNSPVYNSRLKFKEFMYPKSPLISQSTSKNQLAAAHAGCGVCGEADTLNVLGCQGCGVQVHRGCYGIDVDQVKSTKTLIDNKWYCDPCSNSLNPLISTDYECCICQCDYQSQVSPLKRTSDGKWVHVTCALLFEDAEFESIQTLQPINVRLAIASILKSDDRRLSCSFCENKVPINGFAMSNYRVGFIFIKDEKPDHRSVRIQRENIVYGKVRPGVCCPLHSETELGERFFRLSQPSTRYKNNNNNEISLLALYLEDAKKSSAGLSSYTGAKRRFFDFEKATSTRSISREESSSGTGNQGKSCDLCSSSITLKWVKGEDDSTICYSCHLKKENDGETSDNETPSFKALSRADIDLDGSNYGIKNLDDKIVRPIEFEEVYQIAGVPPFYQADHTEANHEAPRTPSATESQNKSTPISSLSPAAMSSLIQKYNNGGAASPVTSNGKPMVAKAPMGVFNGPNSVSPVSAPMLTTAGPQVPQHHGQSVLHSNSTSHEKSTESEKYQSEKSKMSIGNILG